MYLAVAFLSLVATMVERAKVGDIVAEQILSDRIVVSRDVLHGKPHIAGTRVMVYQILDLLAIGKSIEDILSDDYFPDLMKEDVQACIAYASHVIRADSIVPTS